MLSVQDPVVGFGLVAGLAHPGDNVTGVTQGDSVEIIAKRMQAPKDAVPGASRVAVLMNPDPLYDNTHWRQLEQLRHH